MCNVIWICLHGKYLQRFRTDFSDQGDAAAEAKKFPSGQRQSDLEIRRMARIPDNCFLSSDGTVPVCHRDLLVDFRRIVRTRVK